MTSIDTAAQSQRLVVFTLMVGWAFFALFGWVLLYRATRFLIDALKGKR